jgi:hypothetical protein
MSVEERLRSKILYKVELLCIKFIPFIIALMYFIDTLLDAYKIEIDILSHIFGISLLPWCFLILSSVIFKFCVYHRLPLYYIIINHILSIIDYYIGIPIDLKPWIVCHCTLFFLLIIGVVITHQIKKKNDTINKETSA